MKTQQVIVWLATTLAINGFPCQVLAADAADITDDGALLVLAEGTLQVKGSVYKPNSGSVDDAIGLVNECGFLDVRVTPQPEAA